MTDWPASYDTSDSPTTPTPKGKKGESRWAGCLVFGFFLIFFLVGCVGFYFLFVRPLALVMEASRWQATPCVVVSNNVKTHRGDDDNTFSIDIKYRYVVDGAEHTSTRYDFMEGSTGERKSKDRFVSEHPSGSAMTCYVDPNDPEQAVIERGFRWGMLFGLIPLLFLLVGLGGLLAMAGVFGPITSKKAAAKLEWLPQSVQKPSGDETDFSPTAATGGPVTLKPDWSPLGKLLGIAAFAVFWNGFIGIFVGLIAADFRAGQPNWLAAAAVSPFVLVGVLLIFAVFHALLGLFNPQPTVTLSTQSPSLGETFTLSWTFPRGLGSIASLHFYLQGEEQAQYRRGTGSYTDQQVFFKETLIETNEPLEASAGQVSFLVPANTMHSLESSHNKIIWSLHAEGKIARWPDLSVKYPLVVLPADFEQEPIA